MLRPALLVPGIAIALIQTFEYFEVQTGGSRKHLLCEAGGLGDCRGVILSRFSDLAPGYPLSAFAAGFFLASLAALLGPARLRTRLFGWLGLLAGGAYGFIMLWILKNPCTLCLAIDCILIALVGLDWRDRLDRPGNETPLLKSLARQIFPTIALGALTLALGAGLSRAIPAAFAKSHGWDLKALRFDPASLPVETVDPLPAGTLWIGDPKAPVTVLFAQDPKCVYCRESFSNLMRVSRRLEGPLRIGILQYPGDPECNPSLDLQGHQGACTASKILLCTARGDFPPSLRSAEFLTSLYESQTVFYTNEAEVVYSITREWKLPEDRVRACMADPTIQKELEAQLDWLNSRRIQGTPAVWVNGRHYNGLLTESGWARMLGL